MTTMGTDKIDDQRRNAVLAGLRMLQAWKEGRVTSVEAQHDVDIDMIETNAGEHDPMTADELETLCEDVNTGTVSIVGKQADAA